MKTPELQLWGFLFPVLARQGLIPQDGYRLFVTIHPFDDAMANYTTHNSDNKRSNIFHVIHLPSVPVQEAVTGRVYHKVSILSIFHKQFLSSSASKLLLNSFLNRYRNLFKDFQSRFYSININFSHLLHLKCYNKVVTEVANKI